MNPHSSASRAPRREFLRDGLRLAALAGMAAVGGKLAGRAAGPPLDQSCVNDGLCRGCAVLEDCALPRGLSARKVLGQSKAKPL